MRKDLSSYIFIQATEDILDALEKRGWNSELKTPLRVMRDGEGKPISVSAAEMWKFQQAVARQDFMLLNGLPTNKFHKGDKVKVVKGAMQGSEGEVIEIKVKDGKASLTVSFDMFNDRIQIGLSGFGMDEVEFADKDANKLLVHSVIPSFEDEILEYLSHLHGKKGSTELSKQDAKRLEVLFRFSDISFEESCEDRAKFDALMLICAYLRRDAEAVESRAAQLESLLQGKTSPESDLECYLMTALFIVNHNPELRKVVKTYRQQHADCPLSICRFQSIAKNIRC